MSQRTGNTDGNNNVKLIDFNEVRAQKIDEKRRKTERIFFKQLLSVYCVTGSTQMRPIELMDISEDGCSFQVPFDGNKPWPNDLAQEIPIRMYFSQDTYLLVHFKIENARPCIDQGSRYIRYGCSIDKELTNYPAYQQFVRFLKLYSENSHKDTGDVTIFYL